MTITGFPSLVWVSARRRHTKKTRRKTGTRTTLGTPIPID